jgi:hypothetical protein
MRVPVVAGLNERNTDVIALSTAAVMDVVTVSAAAYANTRQHNGMCHSRVTS